MQIYKKMDIGTAKATREERLAVVHHLLDFLSPSASFSAEEYRNMAIPKAREIASRGKIPLFVGGTGLYIDTLMRAKSYDVPESSSEYRDGIMEKIKDEGDVEALWQRLYSVDPESAEAIHKNNIRRVIRALEIYDKTGKPKSYFDRLSREASPDITVGMITLDFHDRENLYRRVNERVDIMMREGLVDEVASLYQSGELSENSTAGQAIGYKEIISYLKGDVTLPEAVELIKLGTRRYAKRQLTWFRHEADAYRLYVDREGGSMRSLSELTDEAYEFARQFIKDHIDESNRT